MGTSLPTLAMELAHTSKLAYPPTFLETGLYDRQANRWAQILACRSGGKFPTDPDPLAESPRINHTGAIRLSSMYNLKDRKTAHQGKTATSGLHWRWRLHAPGQAGRQAACPIPASTWAPELVTPPPSGCRGAAVQLQFQSFKQSPLFLLLPTRGQGGKEVKPPSGALSFQLPSDWPQLREG